MIILVSTDEEIFVITGVAILIIGSLYSFLTSFLIYGFGQLVDNSDKLVELNINKQRPLRTPHTRTPIEKITLLKQFREKNLISEEEFISKLREINGGSND